MSAMSAYIAHVCKVRDSFYQAVALDRKTPLPEEAEGLCPNRIDGLSAARDEAEQLLVKALAEISDKNATALERALERVADAFQRFCDDCSEAVYQERDVSTRLVSELNREITRAIATLKSAAKGTEADDYGPCPPDGFRFRGQVLYGLARQPFLALQYLWGKPDRAAQLGDLAEPVLGDREEFVEITTFHNIRRELNEFFRQHRLPFKATVNNGFLAVKDEPPPTRKPVKTKARHRR